MAHDRSALIRQLVATHDGEPWYGSSRMSLLKGAALHRGRGATGAGRPFDLGPRAAHDRVDQ